MEQEATIPGLMEQEDTMEAVEDTEDMEAGVTLEVEE